MKYAANIKRIVKKKYKAKSNAVPEIIFNTKILFLIKWKLYYTELLPFTHVCLDSVQHTGTRLNTPNIKKYTLYIQRVKRHILLKLKVKRLERNYCISCTQLRNVTCKIYCLYIMNVTVSSNILFFCKM